MPDGLRLTNSGCFSPFPQSRAPKKFQPTAVGWCLFSVMYAYAYSAPPTLRAFFFTQGLLCGRTSNEGIPAASIRVCFCCPATYGRLAFRPSARAAHSPNLAVSNDRSRIRAHCGSDMSLGIQNS